MLATDSFWLLDDARIMGGGQRFALRLAPHLPRATIACPPRSQLARAARAAGVATAAVALPDPRPAELPRIAASVRALRGLAAPGRAFVAGSARAGLYATLAGLDPLVHLMHERDSLDNALLRLLHRRGRTVVAVGESSAAAYSARLGRPVTAVNNFLEPGQIERLRSERSRPTAGSLAVIARMIPEKGLVELIGELAEVWGWRRLRIAAPPEDAAYERRVREAAARVPGVELLGSVADVAALLADADALIVPSTGNEGQPTAILEALAAGVPVVARRPLADDFAGLPVVPYGSSGELSAALTALPREPVPVAEIERRFGPAQVVEALMRAVP